MRGRSGDGSYYHPDRPGIWCTHLCHGPGRSGGLVPQGGRPRRLQALLEGESLFNDGPAIVMFNLMLVIALAGKFDAIESVRQFLTVSGGVVIGIALGIVFSRIIGRIDDPLVEIILSTILAFMVP